MLELDAEQFGYLLDGYDLNGIRPLRPPGHTSVRKARAGAELAEGGGLTERDHSKWKARSGAATESGAVTSIGKGGHVRRIARP